jgi:hypothetical protein
VEKFNVLKSVPSKTPDPYRATRAIIEVIPTCPRKLLHVC